jgi:ribokinase
MSDIEVAGLGALNLDNIYQVEHILDDGETVIKDFACFPGGSAANTICGLAKLGVSTGFIGAVGDDAEGRLLLRDFQKLKVDTSRIRVKPGVSTGSTVCLSDKTGQRSIYVLPGANNHLTVDDLDIDYVNQAKWLHISSFVDEAQLKLLLESMNRLGTSVKVSFSPGALYAARGLEALKAIISRTHILIVNSSEMRQLTGDDITGGAEICLDYGCKVVAVTLGEGAVCQSVEAPCYLMSAENEYLVESVTKDGLTAADTTGAGDAFAAGFLFGMLKGKSLEECGQLGSAVARCSIAKVGARQGLPNLKELSQSYRQLYNKQL